MSEKLPLAPPDPNAGPSHPELIAIDPNRRPFEQIQADALLKARPDLVGLQWHQHGHRHEVFEHDVLVETREEIKYGFGKDKMGILGIRNKEKGVKHTEHLVNLWTVKTYDDDGNVVNVASYKDNELGNQINSHSRTDTPPSDRVTGFAWNEASSQPQPLSTRTVPVRLQPNQDPFTTIDNRRRELGLEDLTGLTWTQGSRAQPTTMQVTDQVVKVNNIHGRKGTSIVWVVKTFDTHGRLIDREAYSDAALKEYFEREATLAKTPRLNVRFELPVLTATTPPSPGEKARLWAGWLATHGPDATVAAKLPLGIRFRGSPGQYTPDFIMPNLPDRLDARITEATWDDFAAKGFLPIDEEYLPTAIDTYGLHNIFTGAEFDPSTGRPKLAHIPGIGYYLSPEALDWDRRINQAGVVSLFSYSDILKGRALEAEIEKVKKLPNYDEYASVLEATINEIGRYELFEIAKGLRDQCLDAIQKLSMEPTDHTKSISWVLWDLARQRYFAQHPDKVDNKYKTDKDGLKVGDPLGTGPDAERKQQEIVARQLGKVFETKAVVYDEGMVKGKGGKPKVTADGEIATATRLKRDRKDAIKPDGTNFRAEYVVTDGRLVNRLQKLVWGDVMEIIQRGDRHTSSEGVEFLSSSALVKLGRTLMKSLGQY